MLSISLAQNVTCCSDQAIRTMSTDRKSVSGELCVTHKTLTCADCHYHYSTQFAVKCVGCETAILKQFVEMNRNGRDECWHPECYMISKVSKVQDR